MTEQIKVNSQPSSVRLRASITESSDLQDSANKVGNSYIILSHAHLVIPKVSHILLELSDHANY